MSIYEFLFRFLIIQVFIPLSKDFAVELMMTNINNSKRRVVLSSSSKDLASTPLHAKLPLSIIKRDIWLNLCLDMRSLTNDMFSNQTFKALEEFTVSGKTMRFYNYIRKVYKDSFLCFLWCSKTSLYVIVILML